MRFSILRDGLLGFALLPVLLAGSPAHAQQVKTLPQGEKEVHFDDGCIVFYDSRGKQTHTRPGCTVDQIERAGAALESGAWDGEPPEIIMGGNGEGEVIFSNDCVVYYDARGQRTRALPKCGRAARHRADDAMRAYRREQGLEKGGSEHSARPPEVEIRSDGRGKVTFSGSECTVRYNPDGSLGKVSKHCSDTQRTDADRAMASYRREQGLESDYAD